MAEHPRYLEPWGTEFWAAVDERLDGARQVLDVGGGRRPTIPPMRRPPGVHYVGIDLSAAELEAAGPKAYDERVAADVTWSVPELHGRFDLIVSWHVLEHVSDLRRTAGALRTYAADGGRLVALFSGRNAVFARVNQVLPDWLGARTVAAVRRRPREEVFPAHYDLATRDGALTAFSEWDRVTVRPLWRGADYFERVPRVREQYLRYEDWALRTGRHNLATHYLLVAERAGTFTS